MRSLRGATGSRTGTWWVAACVVGALAPAAHGAIRIETLSNRADLISGGDALVAIDGAKRSPRVWLDGRDVTDRFAAQGDRMVGLLEGLKDGKNNLVALVPSGGARLTITNHPIGGPVFSGPQIQPWYCLDGALDAQCNRPPTYTWSYMSTTTGDFAAYDPANPPSDVATTTTDQGKTVPYIVRVETGNMDRNQYKIAVLADPAKPDDKPSAWNHKVFAGHGAGCSTSHTEGPAPNVLDDWSLSRGFVNMSTALSDNTYSCNVVVQAESIMMAKEHLIERYGDVRYQIGNGCSGGSIASLTMANAYPGLYDGLYVWCTMPDVPINDLVDCRNLMTYWENPLSWAPGVVWPEPQQAAAAGMASTSVCIAWVNAYHYPEIFQPKTGVGCRIPDVEPATVYDPVSNPGGIRCSFQDYLVNVFGTRPPDRWGANEKKIGHGFANRPYDNTGLQYGLRALLDGKISTAQFVDLNVKIGGVDIDYAGQPQRSEADPDALPIAYRSGVVNEANNLDRIAIIDNPGYVPGDRYEIHDNTKSWDLHARLDAANGHHDNDVLWYGLEGRFQDIFGTLDTWLANVEKDARELPREQKIVADRPDNANDTCYYPDQGSICNTVFGPAGNPRWGAGKLTLANDVIKCQLKPLERSDYFPVQFSDDQWKALQEVFPTGVCDWRKPGVAQQPTVPWQTYAHGPGGRPLGPPPQSVSLGANG